MILKEFFIKILIKIIFQIIYNHLFNHYQKNYKIYLHQLISVNTVIKNITYFQHKIKNFATNAIQN